MGDDYRSVPGDGAAIYIYDWPAWLIGSPLFRGTLRICEQSSRAANARHR